MPVIRTDPSTGPDSPEVTGLYDKASGSIQYIAACPVTKKCALIDAVLDFSPAHASTGTENAETLLRLVEEKGYTVEWVLDTHPHADHMMASRWLRDQTGAPGAIGEKVREIAELWRDFYHLPDAFDPDRDFDRLFADGDTFKIGELDVQVILSPGHTLGSITYVVGRDAAFVHDTFMQPDAGTARADFPGGTASELYESLQRLLELPDDTRLYVGHDYGTDSRDGPEWMATVAQQRYRNIHIGQTTGKAHDRESYVELREARDKTLDLPDRMLFALQVNLRGGRLPSPESDGHSYAKIPFNRF
ncbi:MAG TPA: MBL fold metallo-hydrolase [Rhodobacteraceae bacterium]|nr:MBL fold metallo-hydrolase [Paracoccaceae bacterium]